MSLRIIDSHTGGEPTRVVVDGMPQVAGTSLADQLKELRESADWVRTSLTREPRGADWMVGAALLPPQRTDTTAGVIFFNNVGYLGMCGHGLMGVVATLEHLGRIQLGTHRFETPVGTVAATLHEDHSVSVQNVLSYRAAKDVQIDVPRLGTVVGDIAYGGNWFFLIAEEIIDQSMIVSLTSKATQIMAAIREQEIGAELGAAIDHVELHGPPSDPSAADGKNFVLCPGGHFDRSPCGTGTSAKLACLAADGQLAAGEMFRQESIMGSVFEASYRDADGGIVPTIRGRAFVTAETVVVCHADDPFSHGFPGA